MRKKKAIKELSEFKSNPKNIRFERLCALAVAFGFRLSRCHGSHYIFALDDVKEILDFQERDGKAKPYQVKQLIDLIEKYNLQVVDDNDAL